MEGGMKVRVLFFGQLKDLVGRSSDEAEFEEGARLETVFQHYASQHPRLRAMASSVAMARNQRFAPTSEAIEDGDEVAVMPPVSGGSGWLASADRDGLFAAVTREPIDSAALVQRVQGDADGAVLVFEGVVRDNTGGRPTTYLDYECYLPLALRQLEEIGRDILHRCDVHGIALVHRVGRLQVREASVSIVVAAAHRKSAYEASLSAINEVKSKVPVWKKEYFADGEVWVEGQWDSSVAKYSASDTG